MRRRVLQATVAAVAVAVLLLGFPLAFFGAQFVLSNERNELQARAENLMRSLEVRLQNGEAIPEDAFDTAVKGRPGDPQVQIWVQLSGGRMLTYGPEIEGRFIEEGARNGRGEAASVVVVMRASYWAGYWEAAQITLMVIAAALAAFAAGIAMAVWQANRLTAPLVYLAASAEQLGTGQVRPKLKPSGVEEIDLVADELARSSERLAGRLAAERQFASDASHQLRTPLTALSMRLEEISMASDDPGVKEEARISLEQVERLVGVVDDLLAASRRVQGGTTEAIRLRELVHQQEEEWVPTFAKAGRKLEVDVGEGYVVLATPGGLAQVLATLIENSLKHGAGTTTIRARPSDRSGAIVVEVSDQGEGVPSDIASRIFERSVTSGAGTGLGLALARDLAAADGGRLELAQRKPAVFALFLSGAPRMLDPSAVLPVGQEVGPDRRRRRRRTEAS